MLFPIIDEFKEYKKELNLEKINLNEIDIEKQINNMSGDLKDKESYLSDIDLEGLLFSPIELMPRFLCSSQESNLQPSPRQGDALSRLS